MLLILFMNLNHLEGIMKYRNLNKLFIIFLISTLLIFTSAAGSLYAADNQLKVTFLDIGQGDCEIIRTPSGKIIMIDAGDDRYNSAEDVIIPYFAANGIKKIDMLIMSHAHRDHIGGMIGLIPKIEIGEVYENRMSTTQMYSDILKMLKARNIPVNKLWKDDKIDLGDGIEITVLHPPEKWQTQPGIGISENAAEKSMKNGISGLANLPIGDISSLKKDDDPIVVNAAEENLNNFSIVVRMQYKNIVYQFGGDAEAQAEDEILAAVPEKLIKTYVYKVCHHGSSTSSTTAYLAKLKPEVSVISCGVNNQFRHPAPNTLKNLEFYSKVIYRTDIDKTIESWSDGATVNFSTGSSPNSMVTSPKVTDLSPYSATIEWETSQLSTTKAVSSVDGSSDKAEKSIAGYSLNHKITLTGLKPATAYNFEIESVSQKDPSQVVSDSGNFKTAAAPGIPVPTVSLATAPEKLFVYEQAKLIVKAAPAPADSQITLYEDAVSAANKIAVSAGTLDNGQAVFDWTPKFGKTYELLAVITSAQKVIAVASFNVTPGRRLVVIDEAHGNLGAGYFEDMKVDLFNRGLQTVSSTARINDDTFKNASVFVISEYSTTETGLNKDEIASVKKFVDNGGGLLLIGRCDYLGKSNPETLNRILEQTGSNLRVNDDEVLDPTSCLGTSPWLVMPHLFDAGIIAADVKAVICSSTASVLNSHMKPVTPADKTIIPLCYGDEDCTNIDSDKSGDGVIYPAGSKVVIDAAEIMPSGGKIAVFGSQHFGSQVYNYTSRHQTPLYNFSVVNWLAHPSKKGVEELSSEINSMSPGTAPDNKTLRSDENLSETAVIGASIRADEVFKNIEKEFDPASPKIVESLDHLIDHIKTDKISTDVIKKVLDRVRYGAAEDSALMNKIRPKIEIIEEYYQRMLK